MAKPGDTTRTRGVKAAFDDSFSATAMGGAVLLEQVIRRVGLRAILGGHLAPRAGQYSSAQVVEQVIEGLLCGGKGFQAAELLRRDEPLRRIFGHESVAEEATVFRVMCELAGLDQRKFDKAYEPAGAQRVSLDMFGQRKPARKHRRVRGGEPEAMDEATRARLAAALEALAVRCGQSLNFGDLSLMGFAPVHGDGTDLEVRGSCFDAARINHEGNRSLRLMSVRLGGLYCALDVLPGASDEGLNLPSLLASSQAVVKKLAGQRPVLALLDSAFAEKQVVDQLNRVAWHYVIGANQWRASLTPLAEELSEAEWHEQGADSRRGWSSSAVGLFRHRPEGWGEAQTVIVRRWREEGEMDITPWHYAFLYTNVLAQELPKERVRESGYAALMWQIYGTKQGHENHYKPLLSDLGLHHPPSGRLGATQSFAFVCAMAANLHTLMSQRVVGKADRGIRAWRLARDYFRLAARVVIGSGRQLVVKLAGGGLDMAFKDLWLEAFANARRL